MIVCWKLRKMGKENKATLLLRDLFGGGLAQKSRECAALMGIVEAWIFGKMTPVQQVTDTHVAFSLKRLFDKHNNDLMIELAQLAAAEGTRAIYRMSTYEVLRTLVRSLKDLRIKMDSEHTLMRACVGNGWLALRPSLSRGRFEKVLEQNWAKSEEWHKPLRVGNRRMRPEWVAKRFDTMDENMRAIPLDFAKVFKTEEEETALLEQSEQSYHGDEGGQHFLQVFDALGLSEEEKKEPWFEIACSHFDGEGLEEYKTAIRTPEQVRKDAGIDVNLGSQKPKRSDTGKKRLKAMEARSLKTAGIEEMRSLKQKGYTIEQIAKSQIVPHVGKKAKAKGRAKAKVLNVKAKAKGKGQCMCIYLYMCI